MDGIELSGKNYPLRFDFRALKEFKVLTGSDVLKGFDAKDTDNIIALTFVAIKSGWFFHNPTATECTMTEEEVSKIISIKDMRKVVNAFLDEVKTLNEKTDGETSEQDKPGEIPGIDSKKSLSED